MQPFQASSKRSGLVLEGELSAYLVITPPSPVSASEIHTVVLEMMDLVTLAAGEASGQIELKLVHREPILHPDGDGSITELDRQIESYGKRTHTARPEDAAIPNWRFRFTCADHPFEDLVPAWLSVRRRAPEACNVFFGLQYSRPTYTEVRLLLTAIAAESLHSSLYGDETELPDEAFRSIRARVLSALEDPTEQQWVRQRLRNAPSFRERLLSLASKPPRAAISSVVPDTPNWARQIRDSRNGLAHTGNERTDADILYLERVTHAVLVLVLMSELGLAPAVQQRSASAVLRVRPPDAK